MVSFGSFYKKLPELMKHLDKVAKADYRFVPINPDPGFDPKHNEEVIEKTIREYEAMRRQKHTEAVEKVKERASALSVYLKSLETGGKTSNVLKFFGKKKILEMRGNEVRDQLDQLRVLSKDGKLMRKVPQ